MAKKIMNELKYEGTIVNGMAYTHSYGCPEHFDHWREVHNFTEKFLEMTKDKSIEDLTEKEIDFIAEKAQEIRNLAYEHANPVEVYIEEWWSTYEFAENVVDAMLNTKTITK